MVVNCVPSRKRAYLQVWVFRELRQHLHQVQPEFTLGVAERQQLLGAEPRTRQAAGPALQPSIQPRQELQAALLQAEQHTQSSIHTECQCQCAGVMMWLNVCDSAYRHNAENAPADCDASIWSRSLRASGGHKSTLLRRSKADDSSAFHSQTYGKD